MFLFCMIRYCKGITETEEKELRLFAANRKCESLGKGIVVKFVSNVDPNQDGVISELTLGLQKEGKDDSKLIRRSSSCAEVCNKNYTARLPKIDINFFIL